MNQSLQHVVEQQLANRLSKKVKIHNLTSVSGGCINHGVRVDTNTGSYFLKYNSNVPRDLFIREAENLEVLRKASTELTVPRVILAMEVLQDQPGIIVLELLEENRVNQYHQDERLGVGLAQLHRVTHSQFGFLHNNYCGKTLQDNSWNENWVEFYGQQRIWHLVKLIEQHRSIHIFEQNIYSNLIEVLSERISHQPVASLTHGDLWSGNYLYTSSGPALIDPATHYTDRECDLALMQMFGGFSPRVWDTYQEAFPLPHDWQERIGLYQLYHYLNHYLLFGGSYGQQALSIAKKYL
ncbi:fructosamine kinase family protein [Tunicatimonas pelagia]|uniref:fructosamine kinase family protein n=1 Tax=Tunicatimonas pelagia TaxID=931531 RepID=UPI0026670733|nr:fructosamine kinase family protein [Tunicatimonas pelagia]WKN43093.1 fructosamine kinase family protein [Tunicatimonas pelagia]